MLLSTFSNRVVGLPKNELEVENTHTQRFIYILLNYPFLLLPNPANANAIARGKIYSLQFQNSKLWT